MVFLRPGRQGAELRAALILSALLHAAVLALFKLPQLPLEISGADAVLMVRLAPQGSGMPESTPPVSDTTATRLKPSPLPEQESPPVAAVVSSARPEAAIFNKDNTDTETAVMYSQAQEESQQTPSLLAQPELHVLNPRTVKMVLVVGADGSVGQIIWGELPAVTIETLHEMERRLRQKTYPATGEAYSVNEIIDVP